MALLQPGYGRGIVPLPTFVGKQPLLMFNDEGMNAVYGRFGANALMDREFKAASVGFPASGNLGVMTNTDIGLSSNFSIAQSFMIGVVGSPLWNYLTFIGAGFNDSTITVKSAFRQVRQFTLISEHTSGPTAPQELNVAKVGMQWFGRTAQTTASFTTTEEGARDSAMQMKEIAEAYIVTILERVFLFLLRAAEHYVKTELGTRDEVNPFDLMEQSRRAFGGSSRTLPAFNKILEKCVPDPNAPLAMLCPKGTSTFVRLLQDNTLDASTSLMPSGTILLNAAKVNKSIIEVPRFPNPNENSTLQMYDPLETRAAFWTWSFIPGGDDAEDMVELADHVNGSTVAFTRQRFNRAVLNTVAGDTLPMIVLRRHLFQCQATVLFDPASLVVASTPAFTQVGTNHLNNTMSLSTRVKVGVTTTNPQGVVTLPAFFPQELKSGGSFNFADRTHSDEELAAADTFVFRVPADMADRILPLKYISVIGTYSNEMKSEFIGGNFVEIPFNAAGDFNTTRILRIIGATLKRESTYDKYTISGPLAPVFAYREGSTFIPFSDGENQFHLKTVHTADSSPYDGRSLKALFLEEFVTRSARPTELGSKQLRFSDA